MNKSTFSIQLVTWSVKLVDGLVLNPEFSNGKQLFICRKILTDFHYNGQEYLEASTGYKMW